MLLEMQEGILYGPIDSRRLGKSLGINLSPARDKLCSFNCIYCHYGWTRRHRLDCREFKNDLPRAGEVVTEVEEVMQSRTEFAYITFSGNGEPTLHPDFPEIVEAVTVLRDRYRPDVRVALLSNSTGLMRQAVRESVKLIEMPVFKLDAGTEELFRRINRPAEGVHFQELIEHLVAQDRIYTQTVFIDGDPCNISEEELDAWYGHLKRIKPVEAHIYSIDRPVPDHDIQLVPPEKLEEIARRGEKQTGVKIRAFYPTRKT
jgi:wyosine [tRNA(Phe)-imidazoG37] synthetase (radical SAM superfamily)